MARGIIRKFKDWQERRTIPAAPLRHKLFREVFIVAAALFAQGALLKSAGVPWIGHGPRGLLFMTPQPAARLLAAMFCLQAATRSPKLAKRRRIERGFSMGLWAEIRQPPRYPLSR